jgi:hypothetical protein
MSSLYKILEGMCLQRLEHIKDDEAVPIASAMLAVVNDKARLHDYSGRDVEACAVYAARTLRRIEKLQREKQVGFQSLCYARTKAVFWAAICHGCFKTKSPRRERFLARTLLNQELSTRTVGKNKTEEQTLNETVSAALLFAHPTTDKLGRILQLVNRNSRTAVWRQLAHRLVSELSADEVSIFLGARI